VTTTYTWNPLNQLAQVAAPGTTTTQMIYAPGGQRILMKDAQGVHLYLGDIGERHANTDGTTTEKRYLSLGGHLIATKTRPSNTGVTKTEFIIGDIRGSTTLTVDKGTTATHERWYEPYGALRGPNTVTATNRGYIGQYQDTTGLAYLNNRYYDPTVGVFLSVDPLVTATGEPYLYAGGNPTTRSDPGGLCWHNNGRQGMDDGKGPCGGGPSDGTMDGLINGLKSKTLHALDLKPRVYQATDGGDDYYDDFILTGPTAPVLIGTSIGSLSDDYGVAELAKDVATSWFPFDTAHSDTYEVFYVNGAKLLTTQRTYLGFENGAWMVSEPHTFTSREFSGYVVKRSHYDSLSIQINAGGPSGDSPPLLTIGDPSAQPKIVRGALLHTYLTFVPAQTVARPPSVTQVYGNPIYPGAFEAQAANYSTSLPGFG